MRELKKGRTQEQAAAKANLKSRKTAAKYERLGLLPSQLKKPRAYRTRPDAFAEDWPHIEQMLSDAPELEAKALFEWLQEQQPGKYQEYQLRTFQRRVTRWRALNQPQIATLDQIHEPGEIMELDGTWLTKLGVTIQGQPETDWIHIDANPPYNDEPQPGDAFYIHKELDIRLIKGQGNN